ncbi:zinc ABC transporter ATP-binding protein ZnuC [Aestuariirhabdus litorea]|uniref:Zinc ABC transporter ATP-binding protein ZnuC n=1 Tax=Aestuariirhabdus litorea TaxID=2528527 RepID=A0A3P3VLF5_9GAMM|nr:zinc ABC transporter ATP-binding protein ZnuC [Aestuariirhabdus litorea]RRJ82559.1 zinc ABC transporter ATP-binding protein ZnuC [Aestuariirhabdus litorea]RWW92719.1 zinc ABC transporter ATP-binding protein ZnuC [Endozoicomonadaceae bacterium GTF-13]
MSQPLLRVQEISFSRQQRRLLDRISFEIHPGEIVTLIGPNGAGKTTLVRIVLGLIKADSGHCERQPGLRIGYMPQKLHIEPTFPLTVRGFLRLNGKPQPAVIDAVLQRVGIDHLAERRLQKLSGGEMQRALLARALLQKPQLLVLDEPVQGVDINGQRELYNLIRSLRDETRCAVLMISHDLHLVMAATDNVICLNQHICCSGHPDHVSNHPAYLELFGDNQQEFALYTHHHDHDHSISGKVVPCGEDHV